MSTETLSFGLLGPEKNAFKNCNSTFKIMSERVIFGAISLGVLRGILSVGSPCTFEFPIHRVSSKTYRKIAKRIKKRKYLNGRR